MSGIQRSVFPFGPTITDAYNISTNGTGAFGDNSNNLLTNFTPSKDSAQLGVKGNINGVGTYFSNSVTSIRLPADSSANRPPQGLRGYIRYNTDLSQNNIEYYNGFVPAWQQLMTTTYYQSVVSASPPTQKSYITSGLTTTYTVSSGVLYIKIRMVGGGGGGAGGGNGGNGGNGTDSSFSSLFTAKGGIGGISNGLLTSAASPGGIITVGSGIIITGGQGGGNRTNNTPVSTPPSTQPGGPGGSSYFGGNGGGAGGTVNLSGGAGVAGGGGGGGGTTALGLTVQGAGGSAGGYIEVYLTSPASSYSITVGAGGTAGTAGVSGSGGGGVGGPGVIIIDEYYH